jgi:hypothetical protein
MSPLFECALHQYINCSFDLGAGNFKQLRGTSNQGIQRRGDDLLRRDVINEQEHPGRNASIGGIA